MTFHILKREKGTRLRVKEMSLPATESPILGTGIDTTTLPEGHLSCWKCKGFKFECSYILDSYRIECGCLGCGELYRLLLPLDAPLEQLGKPGKFQCLRRPRGEPENYIHKDRGWIIIHNSGKLCIGCAVACSTQIIIDVKTDKKIILAS